MDIVEEEVVVISFIVFVFVFFLVFVNRPEIFVLGFVVEVEIIFSGLFFCGRNL